MFPRFEAAVHAAPVFLDAATALAACVEPRQVHDAVGSRKRFAVFDPGVNRRRPEPATFRDPAPAAPPAAGSALAAGDGA